LIELFVGEPAVVDSVTGYLMCQFQTLSLWREPLADVLNGPRLFGARRLPKQLRCFFGTALSNERLIEDVLELGSIFRFSRCIAAHPGSPPMGVAGLEPGGGIPGATGPEFGFVRHESSKHVPTLANPSVDRHKLRIISGNCMLGQVPVSKLLILPWTVNAAGVDQSNSWENRLPLQNLI